MKETFRRIGCGTLIVASVGYYSRHRPGVELATGIVVVVAMAMTAFVY